MPPNQALSALLDYFSSDFSTFTTTTTTTTTATTATTATDYNSRNNNDAHHDTVRVAILGCGMMGQEHISYISGYPHVRIDFFCDPHEPSLSKSIKVLREFHGEKKNGNSSKSGPFHIPLLLRDANDLLDRAAEIDLLVIASPNYLHTDALLRWGVHEHLTILVEKPVAVSREQHRELLAFSAQQTFKARIWVAMEYRYIPAIAKLLQLIPEIGDIQMVTIRENRYPFLHKIDNWNRDLHKTGDTLVEKCVHFWDLFRLITGKEVRTDQMQSVVQRGLNYQDEEDLFETPIIDSAYVTFPFQEEEDDDDEPPPQQQQRQEGSGGGGKSKKRRVKKKTIGCLELCMYAEGSRHQEEVIVTGSKGRLEAFLPENKVYLFKRPNHVQWADRSVPPPVESVGRQVFDCTSVQEVHGIDEMPTHAGYHYSSTSVEWHYLLQAMEEYRETGKWKPHVSLADGLSAVDVGLAATQQIV